MGSEEWKINNLPQHSAALSASKPACNQIHSILVMQKIPAKSHNWMESIVAKDNLN